MVTWWHLSWLELLESQERLISVFHIHNKYHHQFYVPWCEKHWEASARGEYLPLVYRRKKINQK